MNKSGQYLTDDHQAIVRSVSDYYSHPEHRRGLLRQSEAEVQTMDTGEQGHRSQPALIITENNPEPQS